LSNYLSRDIEQLKAFNFQKTFNWELYLPIIGWIPGELVSTLAQAVEYEDYNMAEPSRMKAGPYFKGYPKDFGPATLTVKFLETETGLVKTYFQFWRRMIVNSKGLWGRKGNKDASGYGKDIVLLYLTNEGYPLREVKFKCAFPLTSYAAKLSYEDNSLLTVEIQFSVDRVEEGLTGTVGTPFSLDNIIMPPNLPF